MSNIKTESKKTNKPCVISKKRAIQNKKGRLKKKSSRESEIKNTEGNENVNFKDITGSSNNNVSKLLLEQVFTSMPERFRNSDKSLEYAVAMLIDMKPKDQLEGMLAAQMIAVHFASMDMSGRCMLKNQTIDSMNTSINHMTKLMGVFTRQVEALQKYRGKGKQTIQVQHVQVNDGGQAVVGDINVNEGGEG